MNGLGFAILLILCAGAIWAAYAPANKKPAVAPAGRDKN